MIVAANIISEALNKITVIQILFFEITFDVYCLLIEGHPYLDTKSPICHTPTTKYKYHFVAVVGKPTQSMMLLVSSGFQKIEGGNNDLYKRYCQG